MAMLVGGCFCGGVRYVATQLIYPPTLCHCQSCRRASGAHAVGWCTVLKSEFSYTVGDPVERESSPGVFRAYCPDCHGPLSYRNTARPEEIDITLGSLDDAGEAAPADHIFMTDAVRWDRPADGLPQFSATRS
jgi:hypothetical protein